MGGSRADVVDTIRKSPHIYAPPGGPTPEYLLSLVLADAAWSGVDDLDVRRVEGWTAVTAARDWLVTEQAGVPHLFDRIISPGPTPVPNSFRAEIILVAYCEAVIALSLGDSVEIGGSAGDLPQEIRQLAEVGRRVLAWKFDG